jgi:hypothetical protein
MDRTTWAFVFISTTFVLPACAPRIRVIANPKPHQSGIRYYRPKPYLLVTSGQSAVTLEERPKTSTTTTVPDPRYVNIQLQYLPDFEEEYALDVRTGFGTADVGITLEFGRISIPKPMKISKPYRISWEPSRRVQRRQPLETQSETNLQPRSRYGLRTFHSVTTSP